MYKSTTGLAAALLCALALPVSFTHAQEKGVAREASKTEKEARPYDLMVGDAAPALTVKKFVKGDAVSSFEAGKTYVVEFWATWCGPCKMSIPHLTELQKKYAGKVTFIGVSVWENDQDKVEPFVKEWGDKMAYTVAMDDVPEGAKKGNGGKMATSWMKAAGRTGIPSAFIVKDGKIAWVGHPMAGLEESLERTLKSDFNLAAEAAKYRASIENESKISALQKEVSKAYQAGDAKAALEAIDKIMALDPDQEANGLGMQRYMILLNLANDYDQAYAYGAKLVDGLYNKQPQALNGIAWAIVDPDGKVERKDLKLAMKAALRAVELLKEDDQQLPGVLDTLARVHAVSGDNAKAREVQERAISLCKDEQMKAELQKTLDEYRKSAQG